MGTGCDDESFVRIHTTLFMKNVLILSFSDLHRDPRVLRQIKVLKKLGGYNITTIGYTAPLEDNVNFIPWHKKSNDKNSLKKMKRLFIRFTNQYDRFYWDKDIEAFFQKIVRHPVDMIIANDVETLPFSVRLAAQHNTKLYYDAHEFAPERKNQYLRWRIVYKPMFSFFSKKYMPQATICTTTSKGFATEYAKKFGVKCSIVNNSPPYEALDPSSISAPIQLVHHGGALPQRRLELLIEMMDFLDERFCLNFMLVGQQSYIEQLKELAASKPNIRFLPPVPTLEIAQNINKFDIGVHILPPDNFNHLYALPNKLLEYIQGRLAVAIGPSPGMKDMVENHGIGVFAESFHPADLAAALTSLHKEKIKEYKNNSHRIAKQYSDETEVKKLEKIIEAIS